jgi:hypothetical protein
MHAIPPQTWFLIGFLIVFVPIWLSYEYYQKKTGVPVFPTLPPIRRKIIELMKKDAEERSDKRPYQILDLGSGSGQLTWRLAKQMPHAHVTGIELSYVPWLRSVIRQKLFGPKNLEYKRVDFWGYDASGADAVITYLPGIIMERVGAKLKKELKPGTFITANAFYLRAGWEPIETFEIRVPMKIKLFVYRQS